MLWPSPLWQQKGAGAGVAGAHHPLGAGWHRGTRAVWQGDVLETWQGSGTPPGERSPRGPRLTAWYPADDITVQVSMATASHGRLGSRSYVTAQAAGRWPHMAPAPRPTASDGWRAGPPAPAHHDPTGLALLGSTRQAPAAPWGVHAPTHGTDSTHSSQSLHPHLWPALLTPGPRPVLTSPRLLGLARGAGAPRLVMLLRGTALGEAPGW